MSEWTLDLLDELGRSTGQKVDRGVRARHIAASDWGGLVYGRPAAVVRPHGTEEVAAVVRFAAEHGLALTPRATGASSGGQAVADRTVALDVTGMDRVAVDAQEGTVTCGPGASWRSMLLATAAEGWQPHVMPLQLDLTVGGVLSVGGFGAVGHRFGVAAAHVTRLEVVAGDGRVVHCDATTEPELFDAVRGGVGRFGVITEATLALRPAPRSATVVRRRSSSVDAWTSELLELGETFGADDASHVLHVEGFCRSEGGELRCELHLGIEHDDGEPDAASASDAGAELLLHETWPLVTYHRRLDPRFEEMLAAGYTERGHPWVEALISPEAFTALLPDIMAGIAGDAGDRIQVVLVRRDRLPPQLVAPDVPLLVCVVIVPRGIARDELARATGAMARVNGMLLDAGAKRYLAGWFPETGEAAWRSHFGERYEGWHAARERYDPAGTFTSALFAPLDGRA